MLPTDFVVFGVTLFSALAMLVNWKRRRMKLTRRVNRGLRGYVSGKPMPAVAQDTPHDLMVA
jgi:hypothetical protein